MDKYRVRATFAAAELAAVTTITARFGYFDELDPQHGAAYEKVFYGLLAERYPDSNLEDLVSILNS